MKPSVAVLAIGLVLSANVLAQDASVGASSQSTTEMNATLSKPVDARRAKPGDEVTATLAQDATANGGARMPRGTKLIGHVTEAQPRERRSGSASGSGSSRLGIVFDKAVMSDGREIPVNATIQAVGQAAAAGDRHDYDAGGSAFAAGNAAAAGSAAGGAGLAGRVAGTGGATLSGISSVGTGFGRGLTSSAGSVTNASAVAAGGAGASGQLLAGSHGVFGMRGVDLVHVAAGSTQSSVLTSDTSNVQLGRGTQMLLASQAAGDASTGGAFDAAARNASATERR